MSTRCLVESVYETACDRCRAVRPAWPESREWVQLQQHGPVGPTGAEQKWADLCGPCSTGFAAFMANRPVHAEPASGKDSNG